MKVTAIVPSFRPDHRLPQVVRGLLEAGFPRVILVDDGSGEEFQSRFEEAAREPGCVLLRHEVNGGKGRALKTAFRYFLDHPDGDVGAVTVDGDGQHTPEDALRCARALEETPGELILGCRRFDGADVPLRSSFGNRITAWCFRVLCGVRVSDTQTGLRAVGAAFMEQILDLPGDRYEYETNMLLAAGRCGVAIREIPIRTVYLEENASSHFHPLRDSAAIYGQIFRFLSASLGCTVIDLAAFALLGWLLRSLTDAPRLLAATLGARVISSLCNYAANRSLVFHSTQRHSRSMPRYYLLCAAQAAASYGGVYLLSAVLPLPELLAKICTDTVLFLISFQIQRQWVFPREPFQRQEVHIHGK